jgi:hypothetical protein
LRALGAEWLKEDATSSSDAERSKPDPDIVRVAVDKAGVGPERCVMLGDTPYDVEAATRSRVRIVAVRCGGWGDEDLRGAAEIYDDPASLLAAMTIRRSGAEFGPRLVAREQIGTRVQADESADTARRNLMQTGRNGSRGRWVLAAALIAVVGCDAKGGRTDYSKSPDSGAVAPAMRIDTSLTRDMPDSTTGGPDRTGKRALPATRSRRVDGRRELRRRRRNLETSFRGILGVPVEGQQ